MVDQYYRNKLRLRNNLENIYKKGTPLMKMVQQEEQRDLLPEINSNEESQKKLEAAKEFDRPKREGHQQQVSIKKQLQEMSDRSIASK